MRPSSAGSSGRSNTLEFHGLATDRRPEPGPVRARASPAFPREEYFGGALRRPAGAEAQPIELFPLPPVPAALTLLPERMRAGDDRLRRDRPAGRKEGTPCRDR